MTAIRRASFRQRLSDRLVQRARTRWAVGFVSAAAAAAALLLVARWQPVSIDDTAAISTDTPLLYAYVDPDEYSADSMDYLPAEYRVIAAALDDEDAASNPERR